jgi:uncharacterized protein
LDTPAFYDAGRMLDQTDLVAVALANRANRVILERLALLELPQACLVAGAVFQPFLNRQAALPQVHGIKDYDIFYFEPDDLSAEAEAGVNSRAQHLFGDLDVLIDIKNQARVQAWYRDRFQADWPPVASVGEAIGRFPVRCSCLGLRPNGDGSVTLLAPFGTTELALGLLGRNADCPAPEYFRPKAESYRARWPFLRILEN